VFLAVVILLLHNVACLDCSLLAFCKVCLTAAAKGNAALAGHMLQLSTAGFQLQLPGFDMGHCLHFLPAGGSQNADEGAWALYLHVLEQLQLASLCRNCHLRKTGS
jgi:hypothetical protein